MSFCPTAKTHLDPATFFFKSKNRTNFAKFKLLFIFKGGMVLKFAFFYFHTFTSSSSNPRRVRSYHSPPNASEVGTDSVKLTN